MTKKIISFEAETKMIKRLKKIAKKADRSTSYIIRMAIEKFFKTKK